MRNLADQNKHKELINNYPRIVGYEFNSKHIKNRIEDFETVAFIDNIEDLEQVVADGYGFAVYGEYLMHFEIGDTVVGGLYRLTKRARHHYKKIERYRYPNVDRMINNYIEMIQDREKWTKENIERKTKISNLAGDAFDAIPIGLTMTYSWGYEQTNVQAFEVVEKTKACLKIRRIALETVEGSQGVFSDRVKPIQGEYLNEEILTKKPTFFPDGTFSLAHNHGIITKYACGDRGDYRSWGY